MEKVAWVELISPVLSPLKNDQSSFNQPFQRYFLFFGSKSLLKNNLKNFAEKIKF